MDGSLIPAALLGAIQGATEFLPVSSTAHLVVLPGFLGWTHPLMNSLAFDVALHAGTLLALLLVFGRTWLRTAARLASPRTREGAFAWGLVLATLPAAVCGLAFEKSISGWLRGPLWVAAWLSLGALFLLIADRRRGTRAMTEVGIRDAFLIGCAQALALLPGLSRSGITITAGLFLGLSRAEAARYSFMLSVPITAAACAWQTRHIAALPCAELVPVSAGMLAAALVGTAAIKWLLAFMARASYRPFALYRFALAGLIAILSIT